MEWGFKMTTKQIAITNSLPSKATFAVTTEAPVTQVYIPSSVGSVVNLKVGKTYEATLIPNNHDKNASTPWLAIRVEPPCEPGDTFQDVLDALGEWEHPVFPDEILTIEDRLQAAWGQGLIVKVTAQQGPSGKTHTLWTDELEKV